MHKGHKRGPPPICGATRAFHPHNFSHHKNRKKFAQEDIIFRTENTAKSQTALGWKKFRKKFAGKCLGEKESPQSCGEGARGAKIWKISFVCKDSGIILECKRRVLSFCFRTKEPCLCLAGRCLYDLPSFGT